MSVSFCVVEMDQSKGGTPTCKPVSDTKQEAAISGDIAEKQDDAENTSTKIDEEVMDQCFSQRCHNNK